MEHIGKIVQEWVDKSKLHTALIARRAGVSRSTLHRVLRESVDPSIGTLEEIALACGSSLHLSTTRTSDRFAAAAARSMLEDGYCSPDDPAVNTWKRRLQRWAEGNDPLKIVQTAAIASSPLHRANTLLFKGEETLIRLASAGNASKADWALSGPCGLDPNAPFTSIAPSVTILWCDDPYQVSHMLTDSALSPTNQIQTASVAVAKTEAELFFDSFSVGPVRFASPIQIIIDCLSQSETVVQAALAEARSW